MCAFTTWVLYRWICFEHKFLFLFSCAACGIPLISGYNFTLCTNILMSKGVNIESVNDVESTAMTWRKTVPRSSTDRQGPLNKRIVSYWRCTKGDIIYLELSTIDDYQIITTGYHWHMWFLVELSRRGISSADKKWSSLECFEAVLWKTSPFQW